MNVRLRKILDHSSKDAKQSKTSTNVLQFRGMFLSSTLEASVFMGKNYSEILHSIKNAGKDLSLKQMFDIPEKLIVEQSEEIFRVSQISWVELNLDPKIPIKYTDTKNQPRRHLDKGQLHT